MDLNFVGIRDVSNLVELFSDFPPGGFDGETIAFKYRANSSVKATERLQGTHDAHALHKVGSFTTICKLVYSNRFLTNV